MTSVAIPEHDVLFVTLDSCRSDTAARAHMPFIESIGGFREARTHGTYTLPAHMSFFMGYLPQATEAPFRPFYVPSVQQLWRLASSRRCAASRVGVLLDGTDVIDGYRRKGYTTTGFGGVRWFRHSALTRFFDTFQFFGEADLHSVFAARRAHEFPLFHADRIVEAAVRPQRSFVFVNCPETHVPYDTGSGTETAEARAVIERYADRWGCRPSGRRGQLDTDSLRILHETQIAALEQIDDRIRRIVDRCRRPLLLVIAGDHGECFGEDGYWGHGIPHHRVMSVPLLIRLLE